MLELKNNTFLSKFEYLKQNKHETKNPIIIS